MKVWVRTLRDLVLLAMATGSLPSAALAQKPQSQQRAGAPQQQQGLAGPISTPAPVTPPPGTKAEATLLAPFEQGSSFQISPHGGHAATISHKGSRPVIVYDGVPGPIFENFIFPHGGLQPVEFSADGNHFAYCGLSTDHMTIMLDGKELATDADLNQAQFNCTMFFSPNSKHFFYTVNVNKGSSRQGLQYTRFVMDGKTEVKIGGYDNRNIVFSPDGDHFAMVIEDPMLGPNNQAIYKLIVDGKPVPYPGGNPQWSADSKHLYTTAIFNPPHGGASQDLLLDGKPLMRATRITLTVSPVGDMTVALVYVSNNGNPPPLTESWFLVVGGKKVANSEIVRRAGSGSSASIDKVYISPDGKHYAAICNGITGRRYVFADGKKGLEYQRLNGLGGNTLQLTVENRHQTSDSIGFTSPSERTIYIGFNDPSQYLVVGDAEAKAPSSIIGTIVSSTGDHVAVFGQGAPMLDGKFLDLGGPGSGLGQTNWFRFSPDGSHYSFQQGQRMFVDGVPQLAYYFIAGTPAGLWSPDSKHLAYICAPADASAPPNQVGLCLDGKYIGLGQASFGNVTFSPDGSHIYFTQLIAQGGFRLFADGHPVLEGYPTGGGVGSFGKETFEMLPDGTLVLVMQDNAGLKRYAITASPTSSLASLLGAASGLAAKR